MTFAEIEKSEKDFLTPTDVAPVIGCDPYEINIAARDEPELIRFPVMRLSSRVKIPRQAFVKFVRHELAGGQVKEGEMRSRAFRRQKKADGGRGCKNENIS